MADGASITGIDASLTAPGVVGVNCSGSAPDLGISVFISYWATYQDYTARLLTVNYAMTNHSGGIPAYNVTITEAVNTAGVSLETALPVYSWYTVDGTNQVNETLVYHVPAGVSAFTSTLHGSAEDYCGDRFTY
ncbi:MAG: hypothetical protein ACYCXF_07150 [Thermoleophilia bacterium]